MDTNDILVKVKELTAEHLGHNADKIKEEDTFLDDLGADSLDTVELVMTYESEFGIEVADDAAEKIVTVGDAVKLIDGILNA